LKTISSYILGIIGWKTNGEIPPDIKKCVLIAAPHTSNFDFILAKLTYWKLDINIKFLIKKEWFKFPFGGLARRWGGIPVDRSKPSKVVSEMVKEFDKADSLVLLITPEGTRNLVRQWKRGFYEIAIQAKVPIVFGFVDYAEKKGGAGPVFYPTGNYEADMKVIEAYYRTKTARHPERFNLSAENKKSG